LADATAVLAVDVMLVDATGTDPVFGIAAELRGLALAPKR